MSRVREAPAPSSSRPFRVLAGLLLTAQLAAPLHLALVAHTTCEHGELVEASPATHPQATAAAPRDGVSVDEAAFESAEHEHCLACLARIASLAPHTPISLAADSPAAVALSEAWRPGPSRAQLLRAAPKQSPPA